MITLNKQQLLDICYGAAFLGSGGGGAVKTALQLIENLPARVKRGRGAGSREQGGEALDGACTPPQPSVLERRGFIPMFRRSLHF